MKVRVLVVDDSRFFRGRLTEIINADNQLEVAGTAENGARGVEEVLRLKPDVVTMDIEMPVMDGISAVRKIMQLRPTPVLMFSSLTTEGARATLDALDAGALDFLPKRFEDIAHDPKQGHAELRARLRLLGGQGVRARAAAPRAQPAPAAAPVRGIRLVKVAGLRNRTRAVAIGASTGGPAALQEVLTALPADFPFPLLLVQHMPGAFTGPFAARLSALCRITVKEARDEDVLQPAQALLAPGGKQMVLEERNGVVRVRIEESRPGQIYKPSVDITFESMAKIYGAQALAIVLTGMGADGRAGAGAMKRAGALIWAQDEKTSVVYGMPHAVAQAGHADEILPLGAIGPRLGAAGGE